MLHGWERRRQFLSRSVVAAYEHSGVTLASRAHVRGRVLINVANVDNRTFPPHLSHRYMTYPCHRRLLPSPSPSPSLSPYSCCSHCSPCSSWPEAGPIWTQQSRKSAPISTFAGSSGAADHSDTAPRRPCSDGVGASERSKLAQIDVEAILPRGCSQRRRRRWGARGSACRRAGPRS